MGHVCEINGTTISISWEDNPLASLNIVIGCTNPPGRISNDRHLHLHFFSLYPPFAGGVRSVPFTPISYSTGTAVDPFMPNDHMSIDAMLAGGRLWPTPIF